ncbi:GTP-binding protein [Rhodobacteraceae bacterium D3-12]|nr:GTP-binding protein [Rhodobacteraceae bacterium D3-12]
MSGRIPVTVLSGYLGAGKTTIINRLLGGTHGVRLGVLVNDFGPVNIDAKLIAAEGDDLIELSNGCVCCSIGDDLGEVLSKIAARPDKPERLLLEASGVADPARIAMLAGHWPGFELDCVIVAVDGETVQARARDKFVGRLIHTQFQAADMIVLTKGDLIGPEAEGAVRQWLRTLRSETRVFSAVNGEVPVEILLGEGRRCAPPEVQSEGHVHFTTGVWHPSGPVDCALLGQVLSALPPTIHRVKGFVTDAETGASMLIQVVGARCRLTRVDPVADPCLVLIGSGAGKDLDVLYRRFDECLGQGGG